MGNGAGGAGERCWNNYHLTANQYKHIGRVALFFGRYAQLRAGGSEIVCSDNRSLSGLPHVKPHEESVHQVGGGVVFRRWRTPVADQPGLARLKEEVGG